MSAQVSDIRYTLPEEALDRLKRARSAASLLVCLEGDVANDSGISSDYMAAVAEYIADDLCAVLAEVSR